MAIYLPVLTAVLAEAGVVRGVVTVAIAVGTVVRGAAGRHPLEPSRQPGRLASRSASTARPSEEMLLLRVLGITLLVAGLAEQLQVSAAVGAFLVGIALVGPVAEAARKVLAPLRDLFAAVFFVFFGLQTDPTAIPPVLLAPPCSRWRLGGREGGDGMVGGRPARDRSGRAGAGGRDADLARRVLDRHRRAGGRSGQPARLGALAASYVLLLAIVGPLAARAADRAGRRLAGRAALDSAHATGSVHR